MKIRLIVITFWVTLVVICVSGCISNLDINDGLADEVSSITESIRSEIKLNQRQIEILKKQGLTTDYDKLTVKQKNAIEAIEVMLVYLENKYQSQFEYDSYVADSLLAREQLMATTMIYGEEKVIKVFRIYENGEWAYEDNYMHFVAEPAYRKAVISFFDTKIDPKEYKIFSNVEWIDGEYNEADVLKNVAAVSVLYVSNKICTNNDEAEKLMRDFARWIKAQGLLTACTVEVCIVETKDLDNVYSYNYAESITKDWVIEHKICTIDNFGGITIV